jgi:hypothetical protein
MSAKNMRRYLIWVALLVSAIILLWGVWPFATQERSIRLTREDMQWLLPGASLPATQGPSSDTELTPSEERLLVLEWPARIRSGDARVIRLTLEADTEGNLVPTTQLEGSQVTGEPISIPDLYDTHNLVAEARMDIAGVQYTPSGLVSEAMRPGRPVIFLWSVRPIDVGDYQGTVWLYLRLVPLDGSEDIRQVLSTQLIEFQAVNLLGMGGTAARVLGSVGVVVSTVLGLDDLVSGLQKLWVILKGSGWRKKR